MKRIFLTVGTQLPFDRLVSCMDNWAQLHPEHQILAQVIPGVYQPNNFNTTKFLSPEEYQVNLQQADFVVSHAGMGTVISCLSIDKPLIVFPRRADQQEHRNDHQMATAHWLKSEKLVSVAFDCDILKGLLDMPEYIIRPKKISEYADEKLIHKIKETISTLI